jgi:hypothetical protein
VSVEWQSGAGTSFFYSSAQVADFGPYTGPWPLLPSAMVDPHGAETDFVVGIPNPDGTLAHFADGTYATDVFTAWRYDNSDYAPPDSYTGYYHSHYGAGVFSPDQPAGAHLYVVYYPASSGTPPPHEPAYYVPPGYADGGTAAFETSMGHWSDTQAWTNANSIVYNGYNGSQQTDRRRGSVTLSGDGPDRSTPITAGDITAHDGDLVAMAGTAQGQINAGTVGGEVDVISISATKRWTNNNFAFSTAWHVETDLSIVEAQCRLILDGSSVAASWVFPAPLNALQQEVDYSDDPYNGDSYQYIGAAGPVHWSIRPGDFNRTGITATNNTNDSQSTAPILPGGVTLSLRAASGDTASIGSWSSLGPGDEVLALPVSWPAFPAAQGNQNLGTIGDDSAHDIAVVSTKILLVLEPVYLDGTAVPPVANYPMPATAGGIGYGVEAGITWPPHALTASSYRRFRYWVPGPIVPTVPTPPPGPTEPPALRLNQRNDGMGAARHARLNTTGGTPNQPSSFQHTRAPRLFDGGNGYQ